VRSSLILTALAAGPLCGQILVDSTAGEGRNVPARFEEQWNRKELPRLKCDVVRYQPALDYGLRMWSGFSARIPAAQFKFTADERAAVVFRVAPSGNPAEAVYFWQRLNIPRLPDGVTDLRKVELNLGGGFFLGAGQYRLDWMLMHSDGRVCRDSWKLTAKGKDLPTPPGTVESLDAVVWPGFPKGSNGDKGARATIFVNAAPVWPRRYVSRLSPWDRQILISTLNSLLRAGRFTSACVVVFDLQRRRVLFREPAFDAKGMSRLAGQLRAVDLSTISMKTLQESAAPREFLEELMRTELKESESSDAFVFIGTRWRAGPKLPALSEDLKESLPRTWFLAFTPVQAMEQDSVSSLVRAVKGKVVSIYRPSDLASGIRDITSAR